MKFNKQLAQAQPDEELLAHFLASGNQAWLAHLYQRYTALTYGVCLKYLKDETLAADAVMDIYEALVAKVGRQKIDRFRPWLYVVAKHHCLMQLRAQKGHTVEWQDEQFVHLHNEMHPAEAWEKENRLAALEKCVDQLQNGQQQAIRLFYLEQRCYQDIVQATGQDWNTVRSHIQNGRRNLKNCMQSHDAN